MKPRVLLFNPYAASSTHHETALEMALEFREKGYEPHFVTCQATLPTCDFNPPHDRLACIRCASMSNNSLDLIGIGKDHRHTLRLEPSMDPDQIPRFSHVDELKVYHVDGIPVGEGVAFSIIVGLTRDSEPDMEKFRFYYMKAIPTYLSIVNALEKTLREVRPELLYLFHGHSMAYAAARVAAERAGVKYVVGERASATEYILTWGYGGLDLKNIVVELEEALKKMLADPNGEAVGASWFQSSRGGNLGLMFNFPRDQKKGALPLGFDHTKRNIAIFGSSEDEMQAAARFKNPWFTNQSEGISYVTQKISDPQFHFYLRVHPNLKNPNCAQRRQIDALRSANLTIIDALSPIDSYALMASCEKVLTFGSTMGVESAYWGTPSVLAGRAFYEKLNVSYVAKSRENLVELLRAKLDLLPKTNALAYGYWCNKRAIPFRHVSPAGFSSGLGGTFRGAPIRISRTCSALFRLVNFWRNLKNRFSQTFAFRKFYDAT